MLYARFIVSIVDQSRHIPIFTPFAIGSRIMQGYHPTATAIRMQVIYDTLCHFPSNQRFRPIFKLYKAVVSTHNITDRGVDIYFSHDPQSITFSGTYCIRGGCNGKTGTLVDGQMQDYYTVAAGSIRQCIAVIARTRIGIPMPAETVADLNGGIHDTASVNSQIQRIDLDAPIGVLMAVGVVATLGENSVGSVPPVPSVLFASHLGIVLVLGFVDGQF